MYRILTDSSCDLTQEMADRLELLVTPLMLNFNGKEYPNYLDYHALDIKEVYAGLRNGASTSTTAANPESWRAIAEPVLQQGEDVLILAFSSGVLPSSATGTVTPKSLRVTISVSDNSDR